jgi:hypothetical protein
VTIPTAAGRWGTSATTSAALSRSKAQTKRDARRATVPAMKAAGTFAQLAKPHRSLLDEGHAIARNARDEVAARSAETRDRRGLTSADRAARDDARDELERRARVGVGSFEIGAK